MNGSDVAEELLEPSESVRRGAAASAGYIAGSLAYKIVAFLAVPILARLLTPADLGLLDLAVVAAGLLALAAVAGIDHAVARFDPLADVGRLWMTAIATFTLLAALLLFIALVLASPVSRLLFGHVADSALLTLAAAYGIAMAALTMAMNAVRLYASPREFAVLGFSVLTAEIAAAIGIAAVGFPPQLIIGAWAAISALAAVAIGIRRIPRLTSFDASLALKLLAFGIPLVPSAVAWHVGEVSVRGSIAASGDFGGLGAYGIVHRITSVLPITAAGFALAWQPLVYRTAQRAQADLASRGLMLVLALLSVGALGITALGMELITLIGGSAYMSGVRVVPTLGLAAIFSGVFTMVTVSAGLSYRTRLLAGFAFGGAVLQASGAVLLVPWLGLSGAAIASASGYGVAALGAYAVFGWVSTSVAVRTIAIAALAAGGLGALTGLGAESPLIFRVAIASAFSAGVGLVLFKDGASRPAEWRGLFQGRRRF